MITADKVDKVVERLEGVRVGYEPVIEMGEGRIRGRFRRGCGTVCCHAGAYLLARRPVSSAFGVVTYNLGSYTRGADIMANDLGFEQAWDLQRFMAIHPEIWGNERGSGLFASSYAFTPSDVYTTTLAEIIEHWKGVAERLRERERTEQISDPLT